MKHKCAHCMKEYPEQYSQVREVIIRQIGMATRWSAIQEAISAMLHIELMGLQMLEEHEKFHCDKQDSSVGRSP